jgi:type IV secretion system protein VirB3
MDNRDVIFKGATRPAMMLGVPIVPFILVTGTHILLAMWSLVLMSTFGSFVILAAGLMNIMVLRYISTQDDQRLSQYLLRFKNIAGRRTSHHWGAHSLSPIDYAKRK